MIDVSSWTAGRPDRCRSPNPSTPPAPYRPRHNLTVGRLTPTSWPISVLLCPSAANSTIRARCAKPAGIDDARVHSPSTSASPARNTNSSTRDMSHCFKQRLESHFRHATLGRVSNVNHHGFGAILIPVSYTHLRAHETDSYLVCR